MASIMDSFSLRELLTIAKAQRALIYIILFSILSVGFYFINIRELILVLTLGRLALTIFQIIYIYKLAKACKYSHPWIYIILVLFPLVGLILLLVVNNSATKILKANDIDVGFMGVAGQKIRELEVAVLDADAQGSAS